MSPFLPATVRYLVDASHDQPWQVEIVDAHSAYLVRVRYKDAFFFSGAGLICAYPLNSASAFTVSRDKAHTISVLEQAGIACPRGCHFFISPEYRAQRGPGREIGDAIDYAGSLGYPVFAKPNSGSRGEFAAEVTDRDDLIFHLGAMGMRHRVALIQELLRGDEYRLLVAGGRVRYAHAKRRPALVGDGEQPLVALLAGVNRARVDHGLEPLALTSGFLRDRMAERDLTLESVLPAGARFEYAPTGNLSGGGRPADFTTEIPHGTAAFCRKVAGTLGLDVCGIDVITTGGLDQPERFVVIEVNGNPAMTAPEAVGRRDVAIAIWRDICARYFKTDVNENCADAAHDAADACGLGSDGPGVVGPGSDGGLGA